MKKHKSKIGNVSIAALT